MVEVLMLPDPHNRHIGGVQPVKASVSHIAIGIWLATIAVLVIPAPHRRQHRVREHDLLKAYSIATTTFALL